MESWNFSLLGLLKLKFDWRMVEAPSLRYLESLLWLFLSNLCALVYLIMCENPHVHSTKATSSLELYSKWSGFFG